MATGYPYRPLDATKNEIRLLSIQQRIPRKSKLLDFQLEHANLVEGEPRPEFIAVSYAWGDPTNRKFIVVDGKKVSVPENAEIALRNLHRALMTPLPKGLKPKKYRWSPRAQRVKLFIDAVCIDQSNLDERGHQVGIMWRIYSGAAMVLVWLGNDDGKTQIAIEELEKVLDDCRKNTNDLEALEETLQKEVGDILLNQYCNKDLTHLDWSAIASLFSASWFRRLWVIQETVLASEVYCVRGKHLIPWRTVGVAAQWLFYREYWDSTGSKGKVTGLENARLIQNYKSNFISAGKAILQGGDFEASDPHDRIYGFIGLIQGTNSDSKLLQALTPPDYSADVAAVYAKATRALFGFYSNLFPLRWVQIYSYETATIHTIDCPSWTVKLHVKPFDEYGYRHEADPLDCGSSRACDDLPLHLCSSEDDVYTLSLTACMVDHVVATAGSWSHDRSSIDEDIKHLVVQSYKTANDNLNDHTAFDESFARTMVVDSRSEIWRDRCSLGAWQVFLEWCMTGGEKTDTVEYYLEEIYQHSDMRRFFVTSNGFMGMGTRDIQEGDQICILFGGWVPYALRPARDDSGTWTFVGDAYVDGIMDGEYIQQLRREDRLEAETRVFKLR